jgi:hypothetical protein
MLCTHGAREWKRRRCRKHDCSFGWRSLVRGLISLLRGCHFASRTLIRFRIKYTVHDHVVEFRFPILTMFSLTCVIYHLLVDLNPCIFYDTRAASRSQQISHKRQNLRPFLMVFAFADFLPTSFLFIGCLTEQRHGSRMVGMSSDKCHDFCFVAEPLFMLELLFVCLAIANFCLGCER